MTPHDESTTSASATGAYPVGPIDHFFLNDDTDECPAHFFVRATFDGTFDHALFAQAVGLALDRHPLLRSLVAGRATQRRAALSFVPGHAVPYIAWAQTGEPYRHPEGRVRIDLTREYGFRLFVHEGDGQSVLVLQLHHAVVDGTGALMFLEDVLGFYEHLESPGPGTPRLRPLDQAKLHTRDTFHQTRDSWRARRRVDFTESVRLATALPHPLFGADTSMRRGPMPAPTAVAHEFDKTQFGGIRAKSKQLGGTLNDFLVWNLLLAVATWNRRHQPGRTPNIRLGLPVNLRQADDVDVPACNLFSMYFLDRKGAAFDNPAALYASVTTEMERAKSEKLGLVFARLARAIGQVPSGIAALIAPKPFIYNCVDTVNLSNLGLALNASPMMREDGKLRVGRLTLTRFELLPPTRHMTHASIGVASYDGRMVISLHYDPRFLDVERANGLLQAYVSQIVASTQATN